MRISGNDTFVRETEPLDTPTDQSSVSSTQQTVSQETERPSRQDAALGASLVGERQLAASAQQAALFSQLEPEHEIPDRPRQATGPSAASNVLLRGSQGPAVKDLQNQLNQFRLANGLPPIAADGIYGKDTEAAVKQFQEAKGLVPDGKAGPNTKTRLSVENDANFQKLDPNTKDILNTGFQRFQNDPVSRDNLAKFATDPNLPLVSKESQDLAANAAISNANNATRQGEIRAGVQRLAFDEQQSDFKKLDPSTQNNFRVNMLGFAHTEASRQALDALMLIGDMKNLDVDQNATAMQTVLERQDSPAAERNTFSMDKILNSKRFNGLSKEQKDETLQQALLRSKNPDSLEDFAKTFQD